MCITYPISLLFLFRGPPSRIYRVYFCFRIGRIQTADPAYYSVGHSVGNMYSTILLAQHIARFTYTTSWLVHISVEFGRHMVQSRQYCLDMVHQCRRGRIGLTYKRDLFWCECKDESLGQSMHFFSLPLVLFCGCESRPWLGLTGVWVGNGYNDLPLLDVLLICRGALCMSNRSWWNMVDLHSVQYTF